MLDFLTQMHWCCSRVFFLNVGQPADDTYILSVLDKWTQKCSTKILIASRESDSTRVYPSIPVTSRTWSVTYHHPISTIGNDKEDLKRFQLREKQFSSSFGCFSHCHTHCPQVPLSQVTMTYLFSAEFHLLAPLSAGLHKNRLNVMEPR